MVVRPMTLQGAVVRLEPLDLAHVDALAEVALDDRLWQWNPWPVRSRDDLEAYVETAVAGLAAGTMLPFATVDLASGRPIGSSRLANISADDFRAEIGWTWVGVPWQRTAVNSETKLLMLEHAFSNWGCHRVEFKTDSLNEQSRNALLGIGATFEGIFRNHMVTESGRLRHSAYYSITDDDWPAVRGRLEARVERLRARRPDAAPASEQNEAGADPSAPADIRSKAAQPGR
ncbi:MAG: GNAT family N-acetyltransferase [Chloroflexi bacterium]|nr:MAG: GNAT family N-acetyltransferase [Chloroflexota bacterium]